MRKTLGVRGVRRGDERQDGPVSERDQKLSEPAKSGAAGAARWSDYLDWVRSEMVHGVLALSPEEQRTPRVPSGWTLGGSPGIFG